MLEKYRFWFVASTVVLALLLLVFFALKLYQKPRYIRNFEAEVYSGGGTYLEPVSVEEGLAVYAAGEGPAVLLFPYPHGHTTEPMAQGPIARILQEIGFTVISFDVPGAYRSSRDPTGTMEEMIVAADETLDRLQIDGPVDVVGHSMSGFAALAYAVERPERVGRLVLANSVSGFPAAARCGYPGSVFRFYEPNYWRVVLWGMQVNGGRASLATHKQLQNLMQEHAFVDRSFFTPLTIEEEDHDRGIPIRMIWSKNMYRSLSYADRLDEVLAPTLVIAGRHDPEAGMDCSVELNHGIPTSRLVIFEQSGHAPFIEEEQAFRDVLRDFLMEDFP